jgi:hypothetical protein
MPRRELLATARRLAWPLGLAISSALAGSLAAQNDEAADPSPSTGRADRLVPARAPAVRRKDDEKLGERLREGTRISDVSGSFQFSGDRVAFHPDGKGDKGESYRVLENLALERIISELGRARGTLGWTVSGTVTEFKNTNYLLVTKAMVRSNGGSAAAP